MLSALVLLGLGAALSWGAADFWAGTVGVTLWSQAAGTLAVGLIVVLVQEPLQPPPLLWGLAAGGLMEWPCSCSIGVWPPG